MRSLGVLELLLQLPIRRKLLPHIPARRKMCHIQSGAHWVILAAPSAQWWLLQKELPTRRKLLTGGWRLYWWLEGELDRGGCIGK